MPISARGILVTIAASAGQNENFSKIGTVFVYLLSNFRFDNNLLIVVIRRIFSHRTRSLVTLDSELLYKSQMHRKTLGRNKLYGGGQWFPLKQAAGYMAFYFLILTGYFFVSYYHLHRKFQHDKNKT